MAGKTEHRDIDFSGDWKAALAKLKLRPKTPFTFKSIQGSYQYQYTLAGEAKMSPHQFRVFNKLVHAKAEAMKAACVAQIQSMISDMEKEVDEIRKKKWLQEHIKAELVVLNTQKMREIERLIKKTNEAFEPMIDKYLKQFVKGKHHRKKRIQQSVKHAVKVPVAIAAIPITFVASAIPFIAPLGLIALKGAILSIKQAVDYGERHRKGMEDLERRIEKNTAILQKQATRYADLADKAQSGKPEDIKEFSDFKAKIKRDEIVGYAFKQFLDVHRKTISNLEGLIDHYRRKVNKQTYILMDVGRKIDKCESEVDKLRKQIAKNDDKIAEYPKIMKDMMIDNRKIDKFVNSLKADNARLGATISDLQDDMKLFDEIVDDAVDDFLELETKFEGWVAKVQSFKAQRPKSVKNWKKAIKGLAIGESLAEAGFGLGTNFSGAEGLVRLSDTVNKCLIAQGTLADLGNNIQDNQGDIAKVLKAGS